MTAGAKGQVLLRSACQEWDDGLEYPDRRAGTQGTPSGPSFGAPCRSIAETSSAIDMSMMDWLTSPVVRGMDTQGASGGCQTVWPGPRRRSSVAQVLRMPWMVWSTLFTERRGADTQGAPSGRRSVWQREKNNVFRCREQNDRVDIALTRIPHQRGTEAVVHVFRRERQIMEE